MIFSSSIFSQTNRFWKAHSEKESIVKDKSVARLSFPTEFKLFDLNRVEMKNELFKVVDNAQMHSTIISIPTPEGQLEQFEVYEASNFEPALQARFPEIRAFSGRGITDRYATLKLSYSPQGIQTMIFRADKPNEYIEAYSQDHTIYAVFNPKRKSGLVLPWKCYSPNEQLEVSLNNQVSNSSMTARSTGDLKTMRLAQSVTAEYSRYFGATSVAQVGLVLAAVNATLTRCNGCYEKDFAIHLNLIANTTSVFYYNTTTDPYSPAANMGNWNSELQSTLTSVIGESNYDIGHLFGASGGGGNAGCIGCVCTNNQKGSGITSPADGIPQGDNFDIDYVVHEVGHQMGGNHTFSDSNEGTGVNVEVGGGITIMGYAGITSYDPAPHSIPYYHAATIQQIQTNFASKTCPVTTSLAGNNATPVVAAYANRTIPKSTPFALTGSATDADGDALTYSWEQMDDGGTQTNANSIAKTTKTAGPNWISFSPTTSPTRLFPRLITILKGRDTTGTLGGNDATVRVEALSSVKRTLKFRLTVRDNCPYSSTAPIKVGQTSFINTTITIDTSTGPFKITVPNTTGISWAGGSSQTITWNVAKTDLAPINCSKVKISLSTDGGYTFPIVLSDSTDNDGTETFTIPNSPTTTARVKVESVGNIFFDINDNNFTITGLLSGFTFGTTTASTVNCGATTTTVQLPTNSLGGFTTPINLTASNVPSGATVSFGTNPVTPGNTANITIDNINTLAAGTYNITISGVAGATSQSTSVSFVISPLVPTFTQVAPICIGSTFTLPSSSNNGVTGTWSPAINNQATTTYTFTPTSNSCASTATMTVSVTTSIAPVFTQVAPVCIGSSFTLPNTSNNGIVGSWSPSINNQATTTYHFTPNAGQCGDTTSMTVVVNATPATPAFTQVAPICTGGSFTLPTTSNNGISGTWSPAVNNQNTTTYTFTPSAGSCATTTTMTVDVNANTVPVFTQIASICQGGSFTLPTTSDNGISGTWSPAVNNTSTTTYTFTPSSGVCASTATMTVTVDQPTVPTFTAIAAICTGGSFTLPSTSNNSITGTWFPSVNNQATTTYTFVPNTGICATVANITVTVNQPSTPVFTQIAAICAGSSFTLPTSSNNGITGTWSPAINNQATTTYTFTPTAGQCASTATMSVTVNPVATTPTFTQIAPVCYGANISLPTTSNNGISGSWSPAVNNQATTTYTFTPSSGSCAGTSATMTVNVTPQSPAPTGLECYQTANWNSTSCSWDITGTKPVRPTTLCYQTATFNTNTCSWDLTGTQPVRPTTECYQIATFNNVSCQWDVTGTQPVRPTTQCYQIATFNTNTCSWDLTGTQTVPTFNQVAPICPGDTFSLPSTSNNGINGTWSPAINNQATTTYTFTPSSGTCASTARMTVTVSCSTTGAIVYPVPTTDGLVTINWANANIKVGSKVQITVHDRIGRIVSRKTETVHSPEENNVDLNLKGYSNGLYIVTLEVMYTNYKYSEKIIKQGKDK